MGAWGNGPLDNDNALDLMHSVGVAAADMTEQVMKSSYYSKDVAALRVCAWLMRSLTKQAWDVYRLDDMHKPLDALEAELKNHSRLDEYGYDSELIDKMTEELRVTRAMLGDDKLSDYYVGSMCFQAVDEQHAVEQYLDALGLRPNAKDVQRVMRSGYLDATKVGG